MNVGCPTEKMNGEERVALTPVAAASFVKAGHRVLIQSGAGIGAGFPDREYAEEGAVIAPSAIEVWEQCDLIMKILEPQPEEYPLMRERQTLLAFFGFAANRALTEACLRSRAICIACELVEEPWGLPLFKPVREVVGRMSVIVGAYYLGHAGGSGVLATGVPGVAPANILILGAGVAGSNAARTASGLGARVVVTDIDHKRLEHLSEIQPDNCVTIFGSESAITREIANADIVIGAALLPGGAVAPRLITRKHLRTMRPGSVLVDLAISMGGVSETSRPTSHGEPVYTEEGVIHYCVPNMAGAYARTATIAISNATALYGLEIAGCGALEACRRNKALEKGLAVCAGRLTVEAVAEALDMMDVYADAEAELHTP